MVPLRALTNTAHEPHIVFKSLQELCTYPVDNLARPFYLIIIKSRLKI